ncbi:DUF5085 family protein [Listeria seeligeri]|uniref:DUF5085 family protein n=1 Tax=Listeria seeligeri TaxID=1640 RepID=UPI001627FA0E|nr:DUF5085 family protein [Listeria seeligeri]MBC1429966.1 DUF5085 family protein [Listeria seeligeri]MBC1443479.1 DUF5085 family protein [Listeria seeligeri]MBC1533903.1 DUF5085 family protein [Listeria seeligeri]MBC1583248.1 DUF5085 family protein [Listeria seeligeri]MBC1740918.1 DUF5085 family protein [Listeria seeligeri]
MIVENRELTLNNVIGKNYIVEPKDLFIFLETFRDDLKKVGLTIIGRVVVAIESPLNAESYSIEILAEIDKSTIDKVEGAKFQSYYSVKNLIHTRVVGDLEKNLPAVFGEITEYVEVNRRNICTPVFNVLNSVENSPYIEVYVGLDPYDE